MLSRVSAILHALKQDSSLRGVRLTEIALRTGLEKSTTHRLLAALMAEGLVDQDSDSERYRLGIDLVEFGMAVLRRLDVRQEALPVLRDLVEQVEETVHLGVARSGQVVYLEKVECERAFQMRSRVGERMPLYSTGIGKAMLAFLPARDLEVVLAAGLELRTRATITEPDDLRNELQNIRLRGFSTDMEENEEGVRCVAAPIFDHNLNVAGGISIAGPVFRMTDERMADLSVHIVGGAQEISRRLGCTASPYAVRSLKGGLSG